MIRVRLREGRTLFHDIDERFGAGRVNLRAAPSGTGIAGGQCVLFSKRWALVTLLLSLWALRTRTTWSRQRLTR